MTRRRAGRPARKTQLVKPGLIRILLWTALVELDRHERAIEEGNSPLGLTNDYLIKIQNTINKLEDSICSKERGLEIVQCLREPLLNLYSTVKTHEKITSDQITSVISEHLPDDYLSKQQVKQLAVSWTFVKSSGGPARASEIKLRDIGCGDIRTLHKYKKRLKQNHFAIRSTIAERFLTERYGEQLAKKALEILEPPSIWTLRPAKDKGTPADKASV